MTSPWPSSESTAGASGSSRAHGSTMSSTALNRSGMVSANDARSAS
jgi:hypothetical protein